MKKGMKYLVLLAMLPALLAGCATPPEPTAIEQPFLWEISGNGLESSSYLFGTIHIGDPRVVGDAPMDKDSLATRPLTTSPEINAAFDAADEVYTEVDFSDPAVCAETLKKGFLPKGHLEKYRFSG
ncbi:MAG: hypothetical protein HN370_10665 [Phycisphaerales bacterium]|jgi:uncharacterized protein YbaP (TraB family)|nr:hypothetical protein [Phycisphaerales bacterium]